METEAKIAAVHQYVEAFEKADINIIKALYADNATVEDPVGTDAHTGIEAIIAFYEGALQSGVKLTLTGTPRCAGNSVAFPFMVKAPGMGIEVIDVFEFNEAGKVCSMRAYWGEENVTA